MFAPFLPLSLFWVLCSFCIETLVLSLPQRASEAPMKGTGKGTRFLCFALLFHSFSGSLSFSTKFCLRLVFFETKKNSIFLWFFFVLFFFLRLETEIRVFRPFIFAWHVHFSMEEHFFGFFLPFLDFPMNERTPKQP